MAKKKKKKEGKEEQIPETALMELQKHLEDIEEERDEYKDKYLRSLANYENLRKRVLKEKETIYQYSVEKIIQELLSVLDDFGRAFNALKTEENEGNDHFKEGMRLIHSKLKNILNIYQVESFDSIGEQFDPARHEALHVIECEEKEGTIIDEIEKGYLIKDKLLRPARVVVAKEKKENNDIENKEVGNNERTCDRD
ncbi:nucleotide exchange factor GrpE [candidate division WOR-3 bacterium]|nr:nucleotide exchange factor GrpE [candidate division WOR-3 bacterium]MCK4526892.1 nucleotide exchange factor GrpE [candidate division WOR-3 bacterium]